MRPEVPLKVLGLLGPILSRTEISADHALPPDWSEANELDLNLGIKGPTGSSQELSWLLHELPTYSYDNVDEIVAYARDEETHPSWRPRSRPALARLTPPAGYDLYRVFEALVNRYLTWKGGKVAVQSMRMVELHELGLRLPLGPVVRHAHARAVAAGELSVDDVWRLPESVSLLPSNSHGIRAVVRRGLSEGHVHLNAIHATEVGWADQLLKPMAHRPRDLDPADWRLLQLARQAARILALAAATNLTGKEPQPKTGCLLEIFDRMYFANSRQRFDAAAHRLKEAYRNIATPLLSAIMRLPLSSPATGWYRSQSDFCTTEKVCLLRWIDERLLNDQAFSGERHRTPLSRETLKDRELHLVALHVTAHLALVRGHPNPGLIDHSKYERPKPNRAYRFLHGSFFRYLVCRTHFWKRGVQQGRTTGLRHFTTYYGSPQRWPLRSTEEANAETVFSRARAWRGLRVLEGRISPPDHGAREIFPWLKAYARNAHRGRIEKFGLVVHFIKNYEKRGPRDAFFNGAPTRFGALRCQYRKQAFQLFRLLESPSLINPFVVGIDAANYELATPPEVFAPIFRFLRERPFELRNPETPDIDTWRRLEDIRRLLENRRLGMTYHVGEEFRHLLTGLRAIDEVLEFLSPQPGDRIGHGIALGLAPRVWAEQTGFQTLVPKLEWLDTLVWVHHLLGAGDDLLGVLQIEDQIQRLGRQIYGLSSSLSPIILHDVWRLRQLDPDSVDLRNNQAQRQGQQLFFRPLDSVDTAAWRWNRIESQALRRLQEQVGINPPVELLARYWFDPRTRDEGDKLILIDMEDKIETWLEVCRKTQERMQERVQSKQIAIEVNPSTNRLIGPMSRIAEHHIFNLTLDLKKQPNRRLHVTVNTDNPGTTNTSLAHEYYLLGETLIQQGRPEAEVVDWLEQLRSNGNDYSFVRQLPLPDDPSMSRIIDDIQKRHRPLHTLKDPEAILRALWKWVVDPDPRDGKPGREILPRRVARNSRRISRLEPSLFRAPGSTKETVF